MNSSLITDNKVRTRYPDWILWFSVLLLCFIGLVAIYSTGVPFGGGLLNKSYFERQIRWVFIGFFAMILSYGVSINFWKKVAPSFLVLSFILLIAVFIPGVGVKGVSASRWILMPFLNVRLQVIDVVSFMLIVYSAYYLTKREDQIKELSLFLKFAGLVGLVFLLILKQPDLGGAVMISAVMFVMYFIAGGRTLYLLWLSLVFCVLLILLIYSKPYRFRRVLAFLNPWKDPQGISFQLIQGMIAFAMGGLTGVGIGCSKQKLYYLPAAHTDFILAIIAEELGFVATACILLLYLIILWRGLIIVMSQKDSFSFLLGFGCLFSIVLQAIINVGGITAVMPLTGVPLPFVSYGGSSLVVSFIKIGVLLKLSVYKESV